MKRFGRSAREQAEFDKYHVPGSEDVLRNKLDLARLEGLELVEQYFWAKRAQEGMPEEATRLDVQGLKAIHKHHLQDVYEWAGEFRTYTTGRGPVPFATPENIEPWLRQQMEDLQREDHLRGLEANAFAARAAHYVNEINAAHPFIEGNGRTQRVWLRNLAEQAGYQIELKAEDRQRWYAASEIGFAKSDPTPMAELIRERMAQVREIEHDDGKAQNQADEKAPVSGPEEAPKPEYLDVPEPEPKPPEIEASEREAGMAPEPSPSMRNDSARDTGGRSR